MNILKPGHVLISWLHSIYLKLTSPNINNQEKVNVSISDYECASNIPHLFPTLIDGQKKIVLIIGTGLSIKIAPTFDELKPELKKIAEKNAIDLQGTSDAFKMAEIILKECGKPDLEGRLWLACELKMLDDRKWLGEIGLPLSGNTPRHRAIARFAIEQRIRSIISLNWDTLLEAALESIGLNEDKETSRPWLLTSYARIVNDTHSPFLGNQRVFPIIKPHGCIKELGKIRRYYQSTGNIQNFSFRITSTDIENPPCTLVDDKVKIDLAECPLIAIGWKAQEKYLRNVIIDIAKKTQQIGQDVITIIARSWYPNTEEDLRTFHKDIVESYGKDKAASYVAVENPDDPTLDCIFRWLQARYALTKMLTMDAQPNLKSYLQGQLNAITKPDDSNKLVDWVDHWLHTWVRTCWRAGIMQACDPSSGRKIEPWEIPIKPRDAHVPLSWMSCERKDMQSAAKLLFALSDDLGRFNFDMFPGGMWDVTKLTLYLPLPVWGTDSPSDLLALKPLV